MNLKFLPLGSVCLVDGADLKLVVIGYKSNGFDYIAVEYPNGYEGAENLRYFNHEQIKDLYSYGYKDEFGQTHFSSLNDDISLMSDVELVDEDVEQYVMENVSESIVSPVVEDENIEYSPVIDDVIISNEDLEEIQNFENTNSMGSYKFDENGFYASDKDFELLDEKISTLGTNFEETPVSEEIVSPEVSFSMEDVDLTLGTSFEETPASEEIVSPEVSFSMEDVDLTLGTSFEETPVQEEIVSPENSFSMEETDLTLETGFEETPVQEEIVSSENSFSMEEADLILGTGFEETSVQEEMVSPEISFSMEETDSTLGTGFEETSAQEEMVSPEISFSMEEADSTLGTGFEETSAQEEMVSPEISFSMEEADSTLGTGFEETSAQEEIVNPEMSFQFDENGMVVLDSPTSMVEETTPEELFIDVEAPAEVELEIGNTNEESLEVGTLTTDEDKAIFEEMSFAEEVSTIDETMNIDIPSPETSQVPAEDEAMATFDVNVEEAPKKEEKKKRGFFNFGK